MGRERYSSQEEIERLTREVNALASKVVRLEEAHAAFRRRPTVPTDYRMGDDAVLRPVKRRYRHTFHVLSGSPACPLPPGITLCGEIVVWDRVEEL